MIKVKRLEFTLDGAERQRPTPEENKKAPTKPEAPPEQPEGGAGAQPEASEGGEPPEAGPAVEDGGAERPEGAADAAPGTPGEDSGAEDEGGSERLPEPSGEAENGGERAEATETPSGAEPAGPAEEATPDAAEGEREAAGATAQSEPSEASEPTEGPVAPSEDAEESATSQPDDGEDADGDAEGDDVEPEEGGEEDWDDEEDEYGDEEDGWDDEEDEYGDEEEDEELDDGEELEDEEDEEQAYSYVYNTYEAFELSGRGHVSNLLSTAFWRAIENMMEEKLRYEADRCDVLFFDARRAIRRMILARPPSYAFAPREREAIVLILDNSGSMDWWAKNLNIIASLAFEREDVEVYIAPNGEIKHKREKHGWVRVSRPSFEGRTIIYVGDYDGAELPVRLSRNNRVIWVCPETRYVEPEEHGWAAPHIQRRDEFRGVFIRAWTLEEMIHYLSRVHPYTTKAVFDPHENNIHRRWWR